MNLIPYIKENCKFYFTIIFISIATFLSAQNVTETRWYFGNSPENLVFDRNGREVFLQDDQATPFGTQFGSRTSATITDQFTGNLLFYTDGTTVYDASHSITPTGNGLNGNISVNVPVVTCPVLGTPGQYYLFTNSGSTGVNEIQYSIVDARVQGNGSAQFPYGDVTSMNQPTGLINPSEGMIIVSRRDGNLFWLISQNSSSFEINVTQIDESGIGATISYDFTNANNPGFEASNFSFNQDSSKLVMTPRTSNRNIWLMDFDVFSGELSFDHSLLNTGFSDDPDEAVFDAEWSGDGSKLYFTKYGGAGILGQLYQIDFNDSTEAVNPIFRAFIFRSYGLKRGIDNRIYHLYKFRQSDPFTLGRINRPDSTIDSVDYQLVVFDNDFNARQFSEHTPAYSFNFDTLGFHWIDSCLTNVTKFFPIVEPVPQNLTWDFGDGFVSNSWIPNYEYQSEGGYPVTLTAEINGITQSVTQMVEIFSNDLMIDLGADTTICVDEILTLDAGSATSFVWSTGELTQTIEVDTAGTYWVEATNANGCTGFDAIEVTEYGLVAQTSNQWYFGEQAGIEFTGGATAILDGNQQMAAEGCATISDINGDLLFYTNGFTVWNREHEVMLNGDTIGGDQGSAQNSMILPFSGDETIFYLFTTEQVYGDNEYALRYSIVDMKEGDGLGKVVVKNVILMNNSTERITATGFDGNDALIVHEFGNNTFRAYGTSANGLSRALFSPSGEIHQFMDELSATGYMKISPAQSQMAVNIPGTGQVEIFDLDQGEISNPRLIDTGETDLYGMEFSASGNKLYLTTTSSANSKLIQYDLDSLFSADPVADIEASKFDGYTQGANYGALQMGPDGTIYMAVDNSGTIGTINASNEDDASASFDPSGFDLSGRTSRLGLPNFIRNESDQIQVPSMTVIAGCAGQPSVFSATGRDPNNSIENYTWIFGDGQSSNVQDTTHTYDLPGTYNVELRLSNRCDTDTTLFQTIIINNIPENPTVPTDTVICDQPITLTAWPVDNPDFSYYWSTGQTSRQVVILQPALVEVAIINNITGCTSDTLSVFIADARPAVDIGNDLILCQNDPSVTLDSQIPRASSYAWSIDGVVLGMNRTFDVDTTSAGTFEYTIEVINSFGCIARDTIQVEIRPQPDITFLGNPTTGCGNNDGSVELTFNTSGSYSYVLSGPSTFGPSNFDGPGSVNIPSLNPGNYLLSVSNLVTGCSLLEVVQIEDPGTFNFAINPTGNCDGDVELTLTNVPTDFSYEVQTQDGTSIPSGSNQTVFSNLNTGTYFIQVTDNNAPNCVETEEVTINSDPEPSFTFDAIQEICGTEGDIFIIDGSGGVATYTWTGPGIVGGNSGATITVNSNGTYAATAVQAGFCTRTEEIEVVFNVDPSVSVSIDGDPCEGQVTLIPTITNGSGTYLYSWSDGSQAGENTVNTSGTYTVTIIDQFTSCQATSAPIEVAIQPEFEVTLSLSPDCENNGNVLITATTNYFNSAITYEWRDGNGDVLADTDSVLTITQSGSYFVTATNESGSCMAMDNVSAAVVPINPEELTLPSRAAFCTADPNGPTVDLDAGIWNSYEWRLLPDPTVISTDQIYSTATAGTYEVTIYNGFTCITDVVEVVEDCRPVIFAPNAFSPNGNGQNEDFFVFPNDYVDQFEILIYTRWGELVYRSENQDFRWDGFYKGKLLPLGTYAYILKFSSSLAPDLGTIEQYGSVTLVR